MKKFLLKYRVDFILVWVIALNLGFMAGVTPNAVWNSQPATGGDTGSHFYPLYTLVEVGLPSASLRTWNPGNLMGEPHLLHYFPMPYLIMALLSFVVGLGAAFNLGTLLPLFAFPLAVFCALRGLGFRLITSAFVSSFTLLHLFNESYSMWGGNANSLLAGQFSHMYALVFLFLWIGFQARELRKDKPRLWTSLLIVGVLTSHPYIALLIPFFVLSFLFLYRQQWKQHLIYFVKLGVVSFLLSIWYLVPMLLNSPWTTGNPMDWIFSDFWKESFPMVYRLMGASALLCLPILTYLAGAKKLELSKITDPLVFWLIPSLACVGMFFVFPKLGLVDARVIPQIQLFYCIWIGILIVESLAKLGWVTQAAVALSLVASSFFYLKSNIKNYPHWVRWNYSSWQAKPKWSDAQAVFDFIRADFSAPRIANEHHSSLNDTGTTRVWEMAPYFAKRATMESLYQEAAFTTPYAYFLQARISRTPSCPIRGYPCPSTDFYRLEDWIPMLGVKDLILTSPEVIEMARKNTAFAESFASGPFSVFSLRSEVKMVEVLRQRPQIIPKKNWKPDFYQWTVYFDKDRPPISFHEELADVDLAADTDHCNPSVQVDYNIIKLHTSCPGKLHWLKYTYHPSFKSDNGEPIYMVSPGHIALVPANTDTTLRFGKSWAWTISSLISLLCLLFLAIRRFRL